MDKPLSFAQFFWRISALHIITYFCVGFLAYTLIDYETLFGSKALSLLMKPTQSKWVMAGPLFQWIRGGLFAVVLYPLHHLLMKNWLYMWMLFLGLAVFGTTGPAPGSVEGFIYTIIPISEQLSGLPEVLLQTFLFCFLLHSWHSSKSLWWNRLCTAALFVIHLLIGMGLYFS